MTTDTLELPELPYTTLQLMDPDGELPFGEGYTGDDMRAYATAAVLAERERCARIVENVMDFGEKSVNWRAEEHVIYEALEAVASAIRNKE